MASSLSFVTYVCEQMAQAGDIRFRKMFGEYGIYCNDKIVALVCDDQLFVKVTEAGGCSYRSRILRLPIHRERRCFRLKTWMTLRLSAP